MWSSTVWSKIEVISRLPISPSPHLRISPSPRLPSRLPSSSFMPAVNKKILVYRGVVQIRLLHRSFFLHSSWKTAVKTVFSGFSGRATSWTVFTKLGVRVLAENRDSILYTQAMRKQIIGQNFRVASAQGLAWNCAFGAQYAQGDVPTPLNCPRFARPGAVSNCQRARARIKPTFVRALLIILHFI